MNSAVKDRLSVVRFTALSLAAHSRLSSLARTLLLITKGFMLSQIRDSNLGGWNFEEIGRGSTMRGSLETCGFFAFTRRWGPTKGRSSLPSPAQAWTAVHAFHEEARHCQGRSEELSADGMFDRASIRTRWSSLRTRCSMKFNLAALLSLSRPLRTGRGLAVAANSVCPFALLRFLNLLQSDVPTCLLRSDVPFCARGFRG